MTKCYIYTRVSTAIQVDGYSLDAQKDKLRKYADFQNMTIAGEYSDEGKSGKNVDDRPEFLQMLRISNLVKIMFLLFLFSNCLVLAETPQMYSPPSSVCRITVSISFASKMALILPKTPAS